MAEIPDCAPHVIYANDLLVARLGLDASSDNFLLEYSRSWIQAVNSYALSPYLPFDAKASSRTIRAAEPCSA